jgi:1-acyl-sn-glycerol-3-phosphate acyltransferase
MTFQFWHPDHAAVGALPEVPHGWRHLSQCLPLRALYSAVLRGLFGLKVRGFEQVPQDQACVFVGNHGSHYDGFFLFATISRLDPRCLVPVVWDGLMEFPVLGSLLRSLRAVPVRNEPGVVMWRVETLRAMIEHVKAGRHIYILPEGRRDDVLGRFHPGAAMVALEAGVPLVPVTLRGIQPLYKEINQCPRLWGRVELIFHPPLFPADAEGRSGEDGAWHLMKKARAVVASALDYPDGHA